MAGEYTRALQDIHAKLDKLIGMEKLIVQERAKNAAQRVTIAALEKRIDDLTILTTQLADTRAQTVSGIQSGKPADLRG